MGVGKFCLYGFGGFFLVGAAMLPFMPKMTPEQDLASGQRYFSSRCDDVTRNRKINGRYGRGHLYCKCMDRVLASGLRTGDEYRFAAHMHRAAGAERIFLGKARMKFHMEQAYREFESKIPRGRMSQLNQFMFGHARSCSRSV